jgi:hypothetical protein
MLSRKIAVYTALNWTAPTRVDLAPFPAIQQFHRRLQKRPSVAKAFHAVVSWPSDRTLFRFLLRTSKRPFSPPCLPEVRGPIKSACDPTKASPPANLC